MVASWRHARVGPTKCASPYFRKYMFVHTHACSHTHRPAHAQIRWTKWFHSVFLVCHSVYGATPQQLRLQTFSVSHFLGWVGELSSSLRDWNCCSLPSKGLLSFFSTCPHYKNKAYTSVKRRRARRSNGSKLIIGFLSYGLNYAEILR